MSCNRLICIADGVIYHCHGKYYVAGSAQLDLYESFDGIEEIYLWSKIYNISEEAAKQYGELHFENSTKKFFVVGIYDQEHSYYGYIKTFFERYKKLKRLFSKPALIMCQPISVSQWMMWYFFRNKHQIYIGRCIGDPDGVKDMSKKYANQISWMMKHVSKQYYKKCSLQTWVSRELEEKYAIKGVPSVVFHDFLRYSTDMTDKIELSTDDKLKLVFVGRLSKEKGIVDLIRALIKLNNKNIDLTIIGQGAEKENLEKIIHDSEMSENISLVGYCNWGEELFDYMKKADCLVLPSYNEGLGMVLLEAMSNGTMVIASRVGGIPDVVEDNINGLLFEAGNIGELADKIDTLYRDKDKVRCMSEAAVATAKENAREIQLDKFKRAYHKYVYDKLKSI